MMELYILTILMICAAVVAVEIDSLISSVVAVGAVGIGLVMAFLLLRAPDLAITQFVVEILSLIIMVRATVGRDVPDEKFSARRAIVMLTIIFVPVFLYFFNKAMMSDIPKFGQPIMKMGRYYLDNGLKATGAANIVSSIILDFRGYDTLGEATVLLTAVVGVLVVVRKTGRKK